jgi:uncharacterized protein (UPF0333 family)
MNFNWVAKNYDNHHIEFFTYVCGDFKFSLEKTKFVYRIYLTRLPNIYNDVEIKLSTSPTLEKAEQEALERLAEINSGIFNLLGVSNEF